MGMSVYLREAIGNHILRGVEFVMPVELWLVLYTTLPDENNSGGEEVSTVGTAYARQAIGPSTTAWGAPSGSPTEFPNAESIVYATPTGSWGDIVGLGILDQDDKMLFSYAFSTPMSVGSGDPPPGFNIGRIKVRFS
jgi:hypothetical protein